MNLPKFRPRIKNADYIKITILGLGLAVLSQSAHGIILPLRVLDFVGEEGKNTALAAITFTGLVVAMLWQPIASALSDATASRWGRRKPYVILGGLAVLLLLPGIALADTFAMVFLVYCLVQLAANTAQGPYQAYLPELVPLEHRGIASSLKSQMELIGGVTGVIVVGRLLSGYPEEGEGGLWTAILFIALVIGGILLYISSRLREPPVLAPLTRFRNPLLAYRFSLKENRNFGWFLGARLFVFMASATIQTFALFYLRDVMGVADPAGTAAAFLVTGVACMALAIFPAGFFADKYGKGRLSVAATMIGVFGILLLIAWPSMTMIYIAAGLVGFAIGTFSVTNWAMATELVVKGEEARYLAIANMATAGGAAIARLIGPVIDRFNAVEANLGYQVMLGACLLYFFLGGLMVMKIRTPASQ